MTDALEYPYFLVNFKTYEGTAGAEGLEFAREIERVVAETGTTFAIAPQLPDLRLVAEGTDLPVVAQRGRAAGSGQGMGAILLETVAEAGADAAFINHPETPDVFADVASSVRRCRELDLESIVCVESIEMGRAALEFGPDCLLFEDPSDIASEDAMIRTDPDRIAGFVEAIEEAKGDTRVFVGGGVRTGEDVARAFELGVDATGAASAALEAEDRDVWLREIADAVPK
ncbi:triose-phosphate isomerase [Natrialbaceae archaeon A-gly3]